MQTPLQVNTLFASQTETKPGPVFCLLLRVSSDCAQPITGQVTDVTWPVIDWAQPELTPSKRQKTGPGLVPREPMQQPVNVCHL